MLYSLLTKREIKAKANQLQLKPKLQEIATQYKNNTFNQQIEYVFAQLDSMTTESVDSDDASNEDFSDSEDFLENDDDELADYLTNENSELVSYYSQNVFVFLKCLN